MARIRIRETGEVLSETSFRILHKKTRPVLPQVLTKEILDSLGADPVLEGPMPTLTPPYEFSFSDGVFQDDNGIWFTKYSIGPVFNEYEDEEGVTHTVEEQMAAHKARIDENTAKNVRTQRDNLLEKSDWTQTLDSPFTDEMKTSLAKYRQDLRDITAQEGFPHNVVWPQNPLE